VLAQRSVDLPDRRRERVKARADGHKRREPAKLTATATYLNSAVFIRIGAYFVS